MSDASSEKKKRNPVERFIVWGLIAVMVVVVGMQGLAYYGMSMTTSRVKGALEANEQNERDSVLYSEMADMLAGNYTESEFVQDGDIRYKVYRWKGPFKEYKLLINVEQEKSSAGKPMILGFEVDKEESSHHRMVADMAEEFHEEYIAEYGEDRLEFSRLDTNHDGKVTQDETDAAGLTERFFASRDTNSDGVIDEEEYVPSRATEEDDGDGGDEGGDGGGEGGGGRGERPAFSERDTDGDGKITKEEAEAAGRMAEFFDRIDANSDGVIDEEEYNSPPTGGRGGRGGDGGGRGGRGGDGADSDEGDN